MQDLGSEIAAAYPDGVLMVSVLKGGLVFLADLARAVPPSVPVEVDFLAVTAYAPDTGRVRIVKDLDVDIFGRDVLLVEDIVDTGLTLAYLLGELRRREPRSLAVCTLLDKSVRRLVPAELAFVGFDVGDDFLLGYGLDHNERYRNLDCVVTTDVGELMADADALVPELYGPHGGTISP